MSQDECVTSPLNETTEITKSRRKIRKPDCYGLWNYDITIIKLLLDDSNMYIVFKFGFFKGRGKWLKKI